ncbi:BppU family phage baseplate upper protein [Bacillus sp. BSL6]|nr:BppU family phage baseplate upper protein [Bacillus cereus]
MTFKTRELTVDLVNEISTKEIRFSQGDRNSAKLVLNITNEGQELDLSQAKAVRITFKKPDGTTVFQEDLQPINAMEGKYQIILKTQTLAAAGNVYGQVRIFEKDQELDAEPFGFTVKQSYSGDGAVESTNEFTIIQKAIEAGEKLEGVDINGIIAAGELAKGALPKTGGTMTGALNGTTFTAIGEFIFMNAGTGRRTRLFMDNTNGTAWTAVTEKTAGKGDWDYSEHLRVGDRRNWLKNSGDTMTGDLQINTPNKGFKVGNGVEGITQMVDNNGRYYWYSTLAKTPFYYDIKNDNFVISASNTNLLKKTGDAMTGKLVMDKAQPIDFNDKDGNRKSNIGIDSNGRFYSWDEAGGKYFWVKNADGTFTVNADNLVKKTGDTITGTQKMGTNAIIQQEQHKRNANAKGIFYTDEGSATTVAGVGRYVNDTGEDFMYMGHGSSPWNSTSGLRVSPTFLTYKGKNVMTAEKDDRATIPVTADAELITSYGVIADRRGNTVTLRAPIRRKVGSTNGHVFTIPAGMRPTMLLSQVVFSNDGTPALFTIPSDTGVVQLQTISPVITGKDYYILLSYVVD